MTYALNKANIFNAINFSTSRRTTTDASSTTMMGGKEKSLKNCGLGKYGNKLHCIGGGGGRKYSFYRRNSYYHCDFPDCNNNCNCL